MYGPGDRRDDVDVDQGVARGDGALRDLDLAPLDLAQLFEGVGAGVRINLQALERDLGDSSSRLGDLRVDLAGLAADSGTVAFERG